MIRYEFAFPGRTVSMDVETGNAEPRGDSADAPDWALLDNHQCGCCPLKTEAHRYCPAALRVHSVLEAFAEEISIEQVDVTVITPSRTYRDRCDLQTGINSLLGLQMATSGCPVLGNLRSLANFHLPFASTSEIVFRTVGAYLIKQYFEHKDGGQADWDLRGLSDLYAQLEVLNQAFTKRIEQWTHNDAISNAVIMFFAISFIVSNSVESSLDQYRDFFTGKSAEPPRK